MASPRLLVYSPPDYSPAGALRRGREFEADLLARRSVRKFSKKLVPKKLIEIAIRTANSAPSAANRQPWIFVAVSDAAVKREIRVAAEREEVENYEGGRMPPDWLAAVQPLGMNWRAEFLEDAPWLVAVFAEYYRPLGHSIRRNYFVSESVGIACGFFIAALHRMGLSTLTHTPNPMAFLSKILGRPHQEKPFVLFPVGYAAKECKVPEILKKELGEVSVWME